MTVARPYCTIELLCWRSSRPLIYTLLREDEHALPGKCEASYRSAPARIASARKSVRERAARYLRRVTSAALSRPVCLP
jgi:hypothetical protein